MVNNPTGFGGPTSAPGTTTGPSTGTGSKKIHTLNQEQDQFGNYTISWDSGVVTTCYATQALAWYAALGNDNAAACAQIAAYFAGNAGAGDTAPDGSLLAPTLDTTPGSPTFGFINVVITNP